MRKYFYSLLGGVAALSGANFSWAVPKKNGYLMMGKILTECSRKLNEIDQKLPRESQNPDLLKAVEAERRAVMKQYSVPLKKITATLGKEIKAEVASEADTFDQSVKAYFGSEASWKKEESLIDDLELRADELSVPEYYIHFEKIVLRFNSMSRVSAIPAETATKYLRVSQMLNEKLHAEYSVLKE
jgi:hypothetical protein